MSIFFSEVNNTPAPGALDIARDATPAGFNESFGLALDAMAFGGKQSNSRSFALELAREERQRIVEEISGVGLEEALAPHRLGPEPGFLRGRRDAYENEAIRRYAETLPADQRGRIMADNRDLAVRGVELSGLRAREAEAGLANTTIGGTIGALVGSFASSLRDPVVLATLPLGSPAWSSTVRFILTEAIINAGTEAVLQPGKQQFSREIGQETGLAIAAQEIVGAGLFGATFGGVLRGGRFVARRIESANIWRQMIRDMEDAVPDPTARQRAARNAAERMAEADESNPFETNAEGATAHAQGQRDAGLDIADNVARPASEPSNIPQRGDAEALDPASPPRVARPEHSLDDLPELISERIVRMRPGNINVDPARFQFKQDVDDEGITDRLSGTEQWNADAGGVITVWQDNSGKIWVADGHHRLALARRLEAGGHSPIELDARVYREADGHTDVEMRAQAALTNIMNETGTILDAAKIFRERPDLIRDAGLDVNSAFTAAARGISRLSDDAFFAAINEVIPHRLAGIVGETIPDRPEIHASVIEALATRNLTERDVDITRLMVRDLAQMRSTSDAPTGSQGGLFGDLDTLPLKERAHIRTGVLTELRQDRAVFNRLVKEETRIASAGNRLDTDANTKRAQADGEAQAIFEKLTDFGGPLGRLIDDAAAELAAGGNRNTIIQRVLGDFRSTISGDSFADTLQRLARQPVDRAPDNRPGATGRPAQAEQRPAGDRPAGDRQQLDPERGAETDTGQGDLPDGAAPRRRTPQPVAATDDTARFSQPGDAGTAAEAAQLAADLNRRLDEISDIELDLEDGTRRSAGDLLDDIEKDANFLDDLKVCLK